MRQTLAALHGRIRMMVSRSVIGAVNDGAQAQELQVELLADETHDAVERFQGYGFRSWPHAGAEAVMLSVGGLRSHGIVIQIEDRRYRIALAEGEVAMFDDQGQAVHLKRDGIAISSSLQVTVTAPHVVVESDNVELGAAGGAAVARVGDAVANGKIVAGSAKVKAA